MVIAKNSIFESGDGKKLYWLLRSAKTVESSEPLYGFDYGSINIANGELSEFKTFGDDEKRDFAANLQSALLSARYPNRS